MKKLIICAASLLLLVACNNNDNDPVATAPVTKSSVDSFTLTVKSEVLQSPDDVEPKNIDEIALVAVEDAEPISIN